MTVKSALKYPGSKRSIVNQVLEVLYGFPSRQRLVEPFCGACNIALNATEFDSYLLNDRSWELYQFLNAVKYESLLDIEEVYAYYDCNEETYLKVRELFNSISGSGGMHYLWLNKHCFNGLMRYNRSGFFNTPWGKKETKPTFPAEELVEMKSMLQKATITPDHFTTVFWNQIKENDVVYCDPPYVGKFSQYTPQGFSNDDQAELAKLSRMVANNGAYVAVSNSIEANEFYNNCDRVIDIFNSTTTIAADPESRGKLKERIYVYEPS